MTTEERLEIPPSLKVVFIDTWLEEIEQLLAVECSNDLQKREFCKSASEAGHRMKGNGATYGYDFVSQQGEAIEELGFRAMNEKDEQMLRECANTIKKYLEEVYEFLKEQKETLD